MTCKHVRCKKKEIMFSAGERNEEWFRLQQERWEYVSKNSATVKIAKHWIKLLWEAVAPLLEGCKDRLDVYKE